MFVIIIIVIEKRKIGCFVLKNIYKLCYREVLNRLNNASSIIILALKTTHRAKLALNRQLIAYSFFSFFLHIKRKRIAYSFVVGSFPFRCTYF